MIIRFDIRNHDIGETVKGFTIDTDKPHVEITRSGLAVVNIGVVDTTVRPKPKPNPKPTDNLYMVKGCVDFVSRWLVAGQSMYDVMCFLKKIEPDMEILGIERAEGVSDITPRHKPNCFPLNQSGCCYRAKDYFE